MLGIGQAPWLAFVGCNTALPQREVSLRIDTITSVGAFFD